jgi:hypothetical protein
MEIQELRERGIGHRFSTESKNFHFCTPLSLDTKSYLRGGNTAGGQTDKLHPPGVKNTIAYSCVSTSPPTFLNVVHN